MARPPASIRKILNGPVETVPVRMSDDEIAAAAQRARSAKTERVRPPKPRVREKRGATIDAAFESPCPGCGSLIEEGDPITMVGGEWLCEGCADC